MKDFKPKLGSQRTKQIEEDRKEVLNALIANRGIFKGKVPVRTKEEEQEFEEIIDMEIRQHYEKKFGIKLT